MKHDDMKKETKTQKWKEKKRKKNCLRNEG